MSNLFGGFFQFLNKIDDTMVKLPYPPGFDQQDPAYQLTWIDHHIPLLEKHLARVTADATLFTPVAPPPSTGDFLDDLGNQFATKAVNLRGDAALDIIGRQILELKSRRAALVAALNQQQPALPVPAPIPTPQQQRAQKLAEATALEAERDKVAPTISDQNFRRAYVNSMNDKIQKIYNSL